MICAGLKVPFIFLLLTSEISKSAPVVLILQYDKMQQIQYIIINTLEEYIHNTVAKY